MRPGALFCIFLISAGMWVWECLESVYTTLGDFAFSIVLYFFPGGQGIDLSEIENDNREHDWIQQHCQRTPKHGLYACDCWSVESIKRKE